MQIKRAEAVPSPTGRFLLEGHAPGNPVVQAWSDDYPAVIDWCLDYHRRGHHILIITGRDGWARELTERWLCEHLPVPTAGLHMRGDGDFRSNIAVKREIHDQLALSYDIRAAIDDDPEIVELWQERGLAVAMVLDGGAVISLAGGS